MHGLIFPSLHTGLLAAVSVLGTAVIVCLQNRAEENEGSDLLEELDEED